VHIGESIATRRFTRNAREATIMKRGRTAIAPKRAAGAATAMLTAAAAATTVPFATPAQAATPIYSFETLYNAAVPPAPDPLGTRPDGYHNNGGGTTVLRDTIGTTDGGFSLKFTQVAGQTFSAAITEVIPDIATVNHVNTFAIALDVTIPTDGAFAGAFARIGITEFGNNTPRMLMGQAAQTIANAEQNIELVPGTYRITIPLYARVNPADPDFDEFDVPFSEVFGPDGEQQLTEPTSFQFYVNKSSDSGSTMYFDNVQAIALGQLSHWNINGPANWSDPASWLGGVPGGAGANATFSSALTAAATVNVDSPRTVRQIDFNNGSGYTLSGSAITIDTVGGADGAINQFNGAHVIHAPLILNKNTTFRVAPPTSTLLVSDLIATGQVVTKTDGGTLEVNRVRGSGLTISGGTVRITPAFDPRVPGANQSVSNVAALAIAADGRLDLTNTKLVTNTPAGTFSGGAYTGVQREVARAYNQGAWNMPGLMTSQPDAGPTIGTTTIGVASAQQILFIAPTATGTWSGQPVTGASTLVMYTYAGDLTFDGRVDAQDYGIIDNWVQFPGTSGYANGDINYDGVIDAADYGIIDNTIQLQGAPFFAGGANGDSIGGGITAVPEPAVGVSLAVLGSMKLLGRRQRRSGPKTYVRSFRMRTHSSSFRLR
jgi:hypothetical protein